MSKSFFRYPGGKAKLRKIIVRKLGEQYEALGTVEEYREPFWGGGSVGLHLF